MKKILHAKAARANQKSAVKAVVMQQKTATGISYTVRYPAPKKHKGYQPNAASQFGAPATGTCGPA
jgi:hypothetical protein